MTTYYVGPGGSDAANGLSWANRKLTLTGAEAVVAAGDTVYVGPGTYRETLTTAISGSSGSHISFIGDWSGAYTDGVGGMVRITGSDDDLTVTRANAISATHDYRTFRGFEMDMTSGSGISTSGSQDWTVEDCVIQGTGGNGISAATGLNWIIRRCVIFSKQQSSGIAVTNGSTMAANMLVENCIINGYAGFRSDRVSGVTFNHCIIFGCNYALRIGTALAASQTVNVYNSILCYSNILFGQPAAGYFTENYNATFGYSTHSSTAQTPGANNSDAPVAFDFGMFLAGFRAEGAGFFKPYPFLGIARRAGTSMATDDLFGMTRPATDSKKSWGPIQAEPAERSSSQAHGGTYALKLADAGRTQFVVPVSNTSTTFTVYVYREANYAGTAPQMVIKQDGQSDTTVTDAAAAGQWNQLTTTLTPAAGVNWVVVELVSNNTATSGSYAVYFDDLAVS